MNGKDVTADHVIIAVGAKPTPMPGAAFDGKRVITSREAMNLPTQPKKLAIIGAGAIGCEFADFYNAIGTEVTIVEMLPHLLPNEEDDVARVLERSFDKRKIDVRTNTKTDKVEVTADGVRLTLSGAKPGTVEADAVLIAIGVTGNAEQAVDPAAGLELFRGRVKTTPDYRTNLQNVYAVGDCVALHWPEHEGMGGYRHPDLAHVAHHEAVHLVEHLFVGGHGKIDYKQIPGCTYTHPQVASMGYGEKRARESRPPNQGRQVPLPGQRPRPGRRRAGRFRQADLRRQRRRAAGRPHDRRERDRPARRAGHGPPPGGHRGGDPRRDPPAPDVQRGHHGGRRRGGGEGDPHLTRQGCVGSCSFAKR